MTRRLIVVPAVEDTALGALSYALELTVPTLNYLADTTALWRAWPQQGVEPPGRERSLALPCVSVDTQGFMDWLGYSRSGAGGGIFLIDGPEDLWADLPMLRQGSFGLYADFEIGGYERWVGAASMQTHLFTGRGACIPMAILFDPASHHWLERGMLGEVLSCSTL